MFIHKNEGEFCYRGKPCFSFTHIDKGAFCYRSFYPRLRAVRAVGCNRTPLTKPPLSMCVTMTSSFYYVSNISLSCNINIPSFIGNLWWVLFLGNHLKFLNVKPDGRGGEPRANAGHLTSIAFPILWNLTKNLGPRVGRLLFLLSNIT